MKHQLISMLSPVVGQGIYEAVQPTADLGKLRNIGTRYGLWEWPKIEQGLKKPKDYPNRV